METILNGMEVGTNITINIMKSDFIYLQQTKNMGKGIFAKKDIPPHTIILSISEDQYITYERLNSHPIFSSLQPQLSIPKLILFAFYLAYCQILQNPNQAQREIQQYIKLLPTSFDNLICWNHRQLQNLKDSKLVEKIERRKIGIWEEYIKVQQYSKEKLKNLSQVRQQKDQVIQQSKRTNRVRTSNCIRAKPIPATFNLQLFQQIGYQQVLRFVAAVESRSIYYQTCSDSKSQVGALIPLLQFFNHHSNAQCKVQQTSTCEKVITTRAIQKGEQIFVNYGIIQEEQFLQFYGMIPFETGSEQLEEPNKLFGKENASTDSNASLQRKRLALQYNTIISKNIAKPLDQQSTKHPRSYQN